MTTATATAAIALDAIEPSKTNPRKHFDEAALAELAENIRRVGVLQPILVRPQGERFEIVAGERRFRAAKAAGLAEIPAIVRELDDEATLEIQVFENLHRADLHPMEEAEGYETLHRRGLTVEELAAKIGKSVAYVYGRLKLCALVPEARQAFFDDRFTAGHAVILARLAPETQRRLLGDEVDPGPLYEAEQLLWNPTEGFRAPNGRASIGTEAFDHKPISVRELQAWVDKNVRFDAKAPDPILFPETKATIEAAVDAEERLIPITYEHYVPPEAREGRTWGPRSWKRADGEAKSKICDHAVLGVVVIGPERGETFRICVAKEKCKTHWAKEMKEKAERAKAQPAKREPTKPDKWELRRQREEAERERLKRALPKIREALDKAITTAAPAVLGDVVLRKATYRQKPKPVARGEKAEEILRQIARVIVEDSINDDWRAVRNIPDLAKALGVDATVEALLDEEKKAEREAAKAAKKAAKAAPAKPPATPAAKPARKVRA